MITVTKNAAQMILDQKRYIETTLPTITDDDVDPRQLFTGTLDSHSVASFPSSGGQGSINQVDSGAHELLSATTMGDNSFKAVIGGYLTSDSTAT